MNESHLIDPHNPLSLIDQKAKERFKQLPYLESIYDMETESLRDTL